ncbi:MAG: cob(I)yrinic acid a,c-diamide adenosyltransferase [Bacteroidota bacterium]
MKIYTKTGDNGETSLIGGTRVKKNHPRVEAYGTVDELNSFVGLLKDLTTSNTIKDQLLSIQNKLFIIGSCIATEPNKNKHQYNCDKQPKINEADITYLEEQMDLLSKQLPEMRSFILPGGHLLVSYSHITRTVCRRTERVVLKLASESEVDHLLIKYLNRLSDFFFILARYFSLIENVDEITWDAKG